MAPQKDDSGLLLAFKSLLKEQTYNSQGQLADALAKIGYDNVSQSKISRMLSKLGAVKARNAKNDIVYIASDEMNVPRSKHAIQSVVTSVRHNNVQIILKTGIGGAPLIARMLDTMGDSVGILGTLAGDDTIFIAPTNVDEIDKIMKNIISMLDLKGVE